MGRSFASLVFHQLGPDIRALAGTLPIITALRQRLHKAFTELGITAEDNPILQQLLSLTEVDEQKLKQQFELFLMDLLLGLKQIRESDSKAFSYYIGRVNDTQGKSNFWGERFEIFMHHKLLQAEGQLISNLRRGNEGEEADFVFNYKSKMLSVELTTLKFTTTPKNESHILGKVLDKILEKNRLAYANEKCALLIDITNLVTYENLIGLSIKNLFKREFNGFSYVENKIKFGMIILCNSIYRHRPDGTLYNTLNPYLGLIDDNGIVDSSLNSFVRTIFNNFRTDGNYELSYYHLNI